MDIYVASSFFSITESIAVNILTHIYKHWCVCFSRTVVLSPPLRLKKILMLRFH